uniref:Uncharacterized protein n=1 Tax=Magallana gigas TaxID=29159 RepID=A0A8W8MAW6_MAGGI
MKDQISNAEDVSKQIQSIINEIKDEQNKMMNLEKSVEDEIYKTFHNLQRILWNRHANLTKTLKSNVLSKQSHLKTQEDILRRMKLDIEESNKFANQTISSPSAPALFQTKLVEMANVWSVSIFPPKCSVEHGDSLEKNKSATFHVKLRDFQNLSPFKERGLNETDMDVVVKDPKESSKPQNEHVTLVDV